MSHLDEISEQIKDDSLISAAMFKNTDAELALERRTQGTRYFARAMRVLESACGEKQFGENITPAEDTITSISTLALKKALKHCRAKEDFGDQHFLCQGIELDFKTLARCLSLNVEHPYLNGLWISYRAGRVPTVGIEVPGTFESIFKISRKDAEKIVDKAEYDVEAAQRERANEQQQFERELAETQRIPTERVLKRLFEGYGFNTPGTRFLFTKDEIAKIQIPDVWRKLLNAQWSGKPIPWDVLWTKSTRSLLPATWQFLEEKCLGLALHMTGDAQPHLVYLSAYASSGWPGGKGYSAFFGGASIGPKDPGDTKVHQKFDLLPPELQEFYRTVHDGWCDQGSAAGPMPLSKLRFLSEFVTDDQAFKRSKKRPFSMNDMLEVVRSGSGDAVCLDIKAGDVKKAGMYFDHESPAKSQLGLNLWKALNDRIAFSVNAMLPNK